MKRKAEMKERETRARKKKNENERDEENMKESKNVPKWKVTEAERK